MTASNGFSLLVPPQANHFQLQGNPLRRELDSLAAQLVSGEVEGTGTIDILLQLHRSLDPTNTVLVHICFFLLLLQPLPVVYQVQSWQKICYNIYLHSVGARRQGGAHVAAMGREMSPEKINQDHVALFFIHIYVQDFQNRNPDN